MPSNLSADSRLNTDVPSTSPNAPPLLLSIRFSSALPDLALDFSSPHSVRIATLKQRIRAALPAADAPRAIRLIYQGRLLADADALSVLTRPSPSPSPDPHGKRPAVLPRVYILASLGAALPGAALAAEASLAETPVASPRTASPAPSARAASPRGFDRLLDAGLSASEVNQLRLQFARIQESRFTADTMPSPDGLRRMEDAWIDGSGAGVPAAAATVSEEEAGAEDSVDALMRGDIEVSGE
ncbi:hypothetical protein TD95_004587 [Thielaviopsis punctulata]|uniref:Ubiquitin-like domain-containing protein n=1 Tax=Thielaviopsis punctulata TaxID=72032 RepID=A0A0F4ZIF9_9PEZI|nr:hypothetical protein TD95_004587 [Thielaviopsis punctulata]